MDQDYKPIEDIEAMEIIEPTDQSTPTTVSSSDEAPQIVAPVPSTEPTNLVVEKKMSADPSVSASKQKTIKKGFSKSFLVAILVILLIAAGIGAYLWRDNAANELVNTQVLKISELDAKIKTLEDQVAGLDGSENPPVVCDEACVSIAPTATAIESIKASITSGNTEALGSYMASEVSVILAASEGTGVSTSTQAVSSIVDFISDATAPWNFAIAPSIIDQYAAGSYGPYFPDIAVVGSSANNKLISFDFDCVGKIDKVFLVFDQSILQ